MRATILSASVAATMLFTSCQSSTNTSAARWNDMWTDIALRHKYERTLSGYGTTPYIAKERPRHRRSSPQRTVKAASAQPAAPNDNNQSQAALDAVRSLSEKVASLDAALQYNVKAGNTNQQILVDQIKALRARLDQLKSAPAALPSPTAQPSAN